MNSLRHLEMFCGQQVIHPLANNFARLRENRRSLWWERTEFDSGQHLIQASQQSLVIHVATQKLLTPKQRDEPREAIGRLTGHAIDGRFDEEWIHCVEDAPILLEPFGMTFDQGGIKQ